MSRGASSSEDERAVAVPTPLVATASVTLQRLDALEAENARLRDKVASQERLIAGLYALMRQTKDDLSRVMCLFPSDLDELPGSRSTTPSFVNPRPSATAAPAASSTPTAMGAGRRPSSACRSPP